MRIQALLLFSASLALSFMAAQVPARAGDLTNPASLNAKAPATYKVKFDTSKGEFVVEVHRDWAPNGADRFYNLVKNGFYNDARFFRVISGLHGAVRHQRRSQAVAGLARRQHQGRPGQGQQQARQHHLRHRRPDTRTTQVFINFGDNAGLDGQGFAPFGQVISGMEVVDSLYSGYGEGAPQGHGPNQGVVQSMGNAYLEKAFAKLDYVKTATIEP